jgi:ankyrin repeat protein
MQVLKELLDVGAPVDLTCEAGWTPLHRACFNGHAAVAQELVVARKANMLAATKDGRTPILLAAQGGCLQCRDVELQLLADWLW